MRLVIAEKPSVAFSIAKALGISGKNPLLDGGENRYFLDTVAPILAEGDVLGCVIFAAEAGQLGSGEVEYKLAQSIAAFLGKHMEF